jgi:hypothetical protein
MDPNAVLGPWIHSSAISTGMPAEIYELIPGGFPRSIDTFPRSRQR